MLFSAVIRSHGTLPNTPGTLRNTFGTLRNTPKTLHNPPGTLRNHWACIFRPVLGCVKCTGHRQHLLANVTYIVYSHIVLLI